MPASSLAIKSTACVFVYLIASATLFGQTVDHSKAPSTLAAGTANEISIDYEIENDGILQLQLFDASWKLIDNDWKSVSSRKGTCEFSITIPSDAKLKDDNIWQIVVYDTKWSKLKDFVVKDIAITKSKPSAATTVTTETPKAAEDKTGGDYLPELTDGKWVLDWADEFSGDGVPEKWYPFISTNKEGYATATEKGLRWAGSTADTAAMYSTKTGNHWLDGNGNLVIQAVTDKTQINALGQKVKTAYLLSGYPGQWDQDAPKDKPRAIWEGKFVSPKEAPLYITARIRTNEVVGHSTWFAFWLFSKTRAYNDNPVDGTEVDIVEIAKGANEYMNTAFNVANHWNQTGGSESLQFNTGSKPPASKFVDVTDDKFHVYGLEWTTTSMKCYVDGKLYYTFTENIPSDPVDMMMLLTLEYQKNLWDRKAGDGRSTGPFIEDNDKTRVMSRAYIDYVHVWRKQ